MKNDPQILAACLAGYDGTGEGGMWSSATWLAAQAGKILKASGRTRPVAAKNSRGYAVRVETAATEFVVTFGGDRLDSYSIERA